MSPVVSRAAVRVLGLGRAYDEHYALIDLNTTFPAGEVTALLGPNGAGKSTLIGILATWLRPSEGQVFFGEEPVHDAGPALRARIGYVGHRTMLYSDLTARENLSFFARLYGMNRATDRIGAALERVGLTRDADRPVSGFSRGMAQRLTLARALLPDPSLLLLDEPLTGLDQGGVALALSLIAERRAAGTTIVLVTHDLAATSAVADRALILRRGRAVYDGPSGGDLVALYRDHVERAEAA